MKQKQTQGDKQSDESFETLRKKKRKKDDTFLSFAGKERLLIKAAVQYSAGEQVMFSFVLPASVLEITRHINHVDILFLFSTTAVSFRKRGDNLFFKWPLGKSCEGSREKREERQERLDASLLRGVSQVRVEMVLD